MMNAEDLDPSTEYFGDGEFFIQDLDDESCLVGRTKQEMDVNGLNRKDALKHYIVQQRRRVKDLIEIAREHEINLSYTNAVLDQAQDIVITLRKDSETLSKARAVLSEHQSEINYLRQKIDRVTSSNTEADPKMLRLILSLADMLEAE